MVNCSIFCIQEIHVHIASQMHKCNNLLKASFKQKHNYDRNYFLNEPVREKTNNLGFRPGLTQTGLYSHRRWLEA